MQNQTNAYLAQQVPAPESQQPQILQTPMPQPQVGTTTIPSQTNNLQQATAPVQPLQNRSLFQKISLFALDTTSKIPIWFYLILILSVFYLLFLRQPLLTKSIGVAGQGQVSVVADKAEIIVVYSKKGIEKKTLNDEATAEVNLILNKFEALENVSVRRSGVQILPLDSSIGGYQFQQAASITAIGTEKVRQVMNLINNENVVVTSTQFLPADQNATNQTLMKAAMDDAREKAKNIALMSGGRLGKVISVSEIVQDGDGQASSYETILDENTGVVSQILIKKSMNVSFELK